MQVTLRNIKFSEHLSEETNAFTADVIINDKNVGYAKNEGQGGPTGVYHTSKEGKKLIDEAEAYFKSQPKKTVSFGGHTLEIQPSLEETVDELFEDYLTNKEKERFKKKMQKDMLKGLVVGTETEYSVITWKGFTIATLLSHPKGKRSIQDTIERVTKEGRQVLNTNLPEELFAK